MEGMSGIISPGAVNLKNATNKFNTKPGKKIIGSGDFRKKTTSVEPPDVFGDLIYNMKP